jgi:hypothetical protein
MSAATRARLIEALEELGRRFPHWRFGQLVCNVAGWADADVWDAEDESLLEAIRKQAEYQQAVNAGPARPPAPASEGPARREPEVR